jgi:NHL repeat
MWTSRGPSLFLLLATVACLVGQARAQKTVPIKGTSMDVDVAGNIYVLNSERCTITVLDTGLNVRGETGGPGWEPGQFDRPAGIWARNGLDIYVADYGNHRIQRFDRTPAYISQLYTHDSDIPEERFGYPTDVALSRIGELFICDSENIRIVKVNALNQVEKGFGGFGGGKGRLLSPTKLDIGPGDNLYILDGSRIVVFDTFGNFLRELYQGIFRDPIAVFADAERVLVLDKDAVYCFDEKERPAGSVRLETIAELNRRPVLSLAATRESLYLLTDEVLAVIPSPFLLPLGEEGSVDREAKNR